MQCRLANTFFEIIDLLADAQKKPKDYGTGDLLYHKEVDFLEEIRRHPEKKGGAIAELLEVTPGAVTQMSAKLRGKGLLEIYTREGNKKEKFYRLTPSGEEVLRRHQEIHEESNRKLCAYFSALSPPEADAINRFLGTLRECMPICEFSCQCRHQTQNELGVLCGKEAEAEPVLCRCWGA